MLPSERTISGLEAIGLISKVTSDIPGVVVEAEPDMGGPQFGAPIMLGCLLYTSPSPRDDR